MEVQLIMIGVCVRSCNIFHNVDGVFVEVDVVFLVGVSTRLDRNYQLISGVVGNIHEAFRLKDDGIRPGVVDGNPSFALKVTGLFADIHVDLISFGTAREYQGHTAHNQQ